MRNELMTREQLIHCLEQLELVPRPAIVLTYNYRSLVARAIRLATRQLGRGRPVSGYNHAMVLEDGLYCHSMEAWPVPGGFQSYSLRELLDAARPHWRVKVIWDERWTRADLAAFRRRIADQVERRPRYDYLGALSHLRRRWRSADTNGLPYCSQAVAEVYAPFYVEHGPVADGHREAMDARPSPADLDRYLKRIADDPTKRGMRAITFDPEI